jgi:putative FmdB family regulatory protein
MPIYEYLCEGCGKVNERLQKVGDPPPPRCDECGSRKLAKLVSRSAFQLKGGGWYSDLYGSRRNEAKPGEGGADAAPAKGDAKGEAKTDTKGEAKTDTKAAGTGDAKSAAAKEPAAAPVKPEAGAPAPGTGKKGAKKGG